MHKKLKEILEQKRIEVARLRKEGLLRIEADIPLIRDFRRAISIPDKINLISEIKFASPSAGTIGNACDPVEIAITYEKAGAAAISFLTDKPFFNGEIKNLPSVKRAVTLPILRKDFIIDEIQVRESLLYGADAILLIARILTEGRLRELIQLAGELGLATLTEIHDMDDLDIALKCGADIIGINNRDLDTFQVDINTTVELARHVPRDHILVSESGIERRNDIVNFRASGINAVLVGSALMSSKDPGEKVRELVGAGVRN